MLRLASRGVARRQLCSFASPRLTKIVATIGPASEDAEPLAACVAAGLNVMRVNFSHATEDEFFLRQRNLRAAKGGGTVAIMLDTKGPEIRMGGLRVCKESANRKAKVTMVQGETVVLTTDKAFDGASDEKTLYIGYELLSKKLSPGIKVLLDDGLISLEVHEVRSDGTVACVVLNGAEIGERKGVNLPGVVTELPALSEKDKADIRFGIANDIDCVAASFVRSAHAVEEIRDYIAECHAELCANATTTPPPLIISKIETTEALENLEEIVEASDGIMVARGDLGVEVPIEQVCTWQKTMVGMCNAAAKPVIVATQMLESMQKNPRPTRAEVADVTNAVIELADAVMLSGESANGRYPVESVSTQAAICAHAEKWMCDHENDLGRLHLDLAAKGPPSPIAASANALAESSDAAAIVVVERALGDTTRAMSAAKPAVPIVSLSSSIKVCRQLGLSRAVHVAHVEQKELEFASIATLVRDMGLVPEGDAQVVLVEENIVTLMPVP